MTTFVRNDVDALNVELICTVPKADFEPKVKKELLRIQKNAVIKGFRPGKAPLPMISKMYERGVLAEVVSKQVEEDFGKYLQDEKISYLGQPVQVSDNFDPVSLAKAGDFEFKYELGLRPTYVLQGADANFVANRYEIDVTDGMLDAEIDNLRMRYGQREDADVIDNMSVIKVNLTELNLDDNSPKEGGVTKEGTSFFINRMNETLQPAFLHKTVADSVVIDNIMEVEAEMDENRLKSWVLGVDEGAEFGNRFEAVITEIKGMKPATLDLAFYQMLFGEETEVTNEAALRDKFVQLIKDEYKGASDSILLNTVYDNLLESNQFPIPEQFMRKWVKLNNQKMTDADIDKEWRAIARDVRWSIIKSDIVAAEKIQVSMEELTQSFRAEVARYFGNYANPQIIESTVKRLIQNEEEATKRYEEMLSERVLRTVATKITIVTDVVDKEEMEQKMKKSAE